MMDKTEKIASNFPIVGIGASAGGLESFSNLLRDIPTKSGMAFVLIQHLDPNHVSYLRDALLKTTEMPVYEITDGMKIEPNNVYVIPPGFDIDILHGVLRLLPRDQSPGVPHMPINSFFRSLAAHCGEKAIGVVLSGTASDGTEGLRAIKGEGGFTFVEDPKSAKFSGMPESAVNAGVVDYALSLPQLAQELVRLKQHDYYSENDEPFSSLEEQHDFERILNHLKNELNVDFNEYKPATLKRRLVRRLALLRINKLSRYLEYLREDPDEAKILYEDVLIHVTSFFRDPEAFESLKNNVFPEIIKNNKPNSPIRMWVAGCSTGEEVYSLVMAFLEFLGDLPSKFPIQVFGSDISELMINKARAGIYPETISKEVSPERLKRFFVKIDNGYRINKIVRDLCIFVRHDLARDPPFSRLNLITCRNVLIYFDHNLQKRIFSTFHYCLKQPGYLLLGRTENVSDHLQLFIPIDKANKVFTRSAVPSQLRFQIPKDPSKIEAKPFERLPIEDKPNIDISRSVDNLLLAEYAPCGVLVNERMDILQFRGRTSQYLEQPPGEPERNLMKIIREGLFVSLKMTFTKAQQEMTVARKDGVILKTNGFTHVCNIIVHPFLNHPTIKENLFLILFEEAKQSKAGRQKFNFFSRKPSRNERIEEELRSTRLEEELALTKEYLQSLNLEHQKANDSLATANEELISGNEELQSMNEELETAKEELQSINEELTTVNDELQNSNMEVGQVNNDLVNLLNSVEIPIVILDINRRIRRFTPHAKTIMNLLATDVGRSIDDIKPNVTVQDLDKQISEAIENDIVKESEVQDRAGRWFRIQIRPYKTLENTIDGVVLSLIDINKLRNAVNKAQLAGDYARSIVEGIQIPLLLLDNTAKVLSANGAFYELFNVPDGNANSNLLFELGLSEWDVPSLGVSLEELIKKNILCKNIEMDREIPGSGRRSITLSTQPIHFDNDLPGMILLAIADVSREKEITREREELLRLSQDAKNELRLVSDSVPIHLIHLDENERFIFINKVVSEMWGIPIAEMIGKTIKEIIGEENQKRLHHYTQSVLQGETVSYESPFTDKNGSKRIFLTTYTPGIRDSAGIIHSFLAAGTDITDRIKIEKTLQKSLDDLGQERVLRERFVSALTHDLRSPLTGAKMNAQMIIKAISDPASLQRISERIVKSVDRADSMIRDLLDANRLKAGETLHLNIVECELSKLLSKIKEDLTLIHGDRFICSQGEIKGYWDPSSITRMIENLVTNAVKYGSDKEPITISFRTFDNKVEIAVHNKGQPIGPEDQKNIFLQYQRLVTTAGRSVGGWGIGLALVQGLAESHGGEVAVRSSEIEGTTFTVILPLDARAAHS